MGLFDRFRRKPCRAQMNPKRHHQKNGKEEMGLANMSYLLGKTFATSGRSGGSKWPYGTSTYSEPHNKPLRNQTTGT